MVYFLAFRHHGQVESVNIETFFIPGSSQPRPTNSWPPSDLVG
jgi:hypothetical protein